MPFVPLSDGAGVVAAIGERVKNLLPGEKVFTVFKPMWRSGRLQREFEISNLASPDVPGVLSEYVVLDQEYWAPMPSNLTFIEASTLPIAGVTAWNALYGLCDYQPRPGQCVLTEGTGGFAKAGGAKVIATTSSTRKGDMLLGLGADHVVNYKEETEWADAVKSLTPGNKGVDLVVDVVGGNTTTQALKAVKSDGLVAIVGFIAGLAEQQPSTVDVFFNMATCRAIHCGSLEHLLQMKAAIEQHNIKPYVDRVFKFEDAPVAYEYMSEQKFIGKICIIAADKIGLAVLRRRRGQLDLDRQRWAFLQIEQLTELDSPGAIKDRLGKLPRGLTEAYHELSIFPEALSEDSSIKYDLQILRGFTGSGAETTYKNTNNNPTFAPFGFIPIAGPKDAVSSISKRDDSYIEVVDCSGITLSGSQSVSIFCSNDSDESNSNDMLKGRLEGTVLWMPDNCSPATYIIARSLEVLEDPSLPGHLVKRKPDNREVLDLIFHYDFKQVKRSDEKIYMRVDWSNAAGYWDEIVAASLDENSKRSLDPRHLGQRGLDKLFFSDDSAEWSRKFESLRDLRFWTDFSSPAITVLINDEVKCDDGGFLQIEAKTKSKVYAKFGFTMISTLYPFNFDSVYGFLDTWYDIDVEQPKTGEDTEKQDMASMQPGLVNLVPNFNIYFGLEADDGEFTADFKTKFSIKSDPDSNRGWVRRIFPSTVGKSLGAFNIGLEVEATGASDLKRDVGNLEPRQGVSGAKYDISLYLPVALILQSKGLYKGNKALHYGIYATAGDAFGNWGSEPANGE
ncbi:alcohol dehydrogenase [Fusarium sporotrichioides]|uniref:Alcohol dehydrogenase n=1 Tax=Fusarium sporotrichioides TaxID=5514 RepID=A0A395REI6_FUSSP|nr:alcohol dehydrogenase [Fusarium sporotrichioides]